MNSRTQQLGEGAYEVVLTLTVTVKNDNDTAFLAEIQQAGIFTIAGLEEGELHHTLGAFCPNILFPYAREAIDNMASKASFPPLMLAPVNFDALYAQQLAQQQAQAEGSCTLSVYFNIKKAGATAPAFLYLHDTWRKRLTFYLCSSPPSAI